MYPTLVVVLIATRRNYLERSVEGATITGSRLLRGMYFASNAHDSEYGIPSRRSTIQSLRTDNIASSHESIIPLNISFGPAFDPGMDLLDPHLDEKHNDAREDQKLLAMHYPSSGSSSTSTDAPRLDSVAFEKIVLIAPDQ